MVTLRELLDEPVEERDDRLEDKWWQYDVDEWDGVVYDGEGNIAFVRDEHGNWLPFPNQEVAANGVNVNNQEGAENVNDQAINNVQNQEVVENVNNQEDVENVNNEAVDNVGDQEDAENVYNQAVDNIFGDQEDVENVNDKEEVDQEVKKDQEEVENVNNQAGDNVGDQEDKWWQYNIDELAGVMYDGEGNIAFVRDESGDYWLPFENQEVAANGDNVNNQQGVENVYDQEVGENVNNQEDVDDKEEVDQEDVKNVNDKEEVDQEVDDQEDVENVNDKEEVDQEVDDQEDVENVNDKEEVDQEVDDQEDVENVNNVGEQEDMENMKDKEEVDQEVDNFDDQEDGENLNDKEVDQEVKKVNDQESENVKVQEIKTIKDQDTTNVEEQEIKNVGDQEGENVKAEEIKNIDKQVSEVDDDTKTEDSIKTKRVMGTNDDNQVESSEHDGTVNSRENESGKGLVGNVSEGLGVSGNNSMDGAKNVMGTDDEVGGGTKSGEDEGSNRADEHDSGKGLVGNASEGLGVSGNNSMDGTKNVMGTDDEVGGGTKSGEDEEHDSGKGLAGNASEGLGVSGNNSMEGTKRVYMGTDDEVGGGTKSGEDEGSNGADEHDSGKGLVGNSGKGLGVSWGNKRHIMTAAEEQEHQDGLKRVKTASTGNIATASHVDDQKGENQENPKLNSEENPNGGDVTKAETSSESSIKMERVKYDEDEEVKSHKTENKRRFMAEERNEQQEGSKRAKKDQSSAATAIIPTTGHDDSGGSVKHRLGSYFTKLKKWWHGD